MKPINSYNDYINALGGRGDIFVFRGQANIDFVNGVDIVGNEKFDSILSLGGEGLIGPKKGDTEYVFPIGVFFTFLNITKATDPDKAHQFDIVVTDQAGKSTTGTLKVHITE